ncbi:MAG: hypothetical protein HRT47_11545 [Candidatus Caenarcaniphilales bacterium]|nr:hypothetical protein [Candidatus Caenarcaniphilales bacterium]
MKKYSYPISLFVILVLNYFGIGRWFINLIGYQYLIESAKSLLESYREHAVKVFLLLSGLEAGLAVMKSLEVGISFIADIQSKLGNVLSSFYNLIITAWTGSLISITSMTLLDNLLSIIDYLAIPIISLVVIVLLITWLVDNYINSENISVLTFISYMDTFKKAFSYLGSGLAFGLPLLIVISGLIVNQFHLPHAKNIYQEITKHEHIQFLDKDQEVNSQVKASKETYQEVHKNLSEKLASAILYVPKHIALVLMDLLVLPGAAIYFLFVLFNFCINQFKEGESTAVGIAKILSDA